MEQKEDIPIITCDSESGMIIVNACELEHKCSFCGTEITTKNFGGIFSKPTKLCCNNICCLFEAIPDKEK